MDQGQGLLCLIATVETQGIGPGTPDHGHCALGTGPLVLGLLNHWTGVLLACHLYSRTNFKLIRAAALSEWRQLLSA